MNLSCLYRANINISVTQKRKQAYFSKLLNQAFVVV